MRHPWFVWSVALAAGCGSVTTPPSEPDAGAGSADAAPGEVELVVVSGDMQEGVVGQALDPITLRLQQDGEGVPSKNVTFALASGAGTLSAMSAATDHDGKATVTLTPGPEAGAIVLRVSDSDGHALDVSAKGLAAAPAAIKIVSGNNQTVPVATAAAPLVVSVVDASGNPVANAGVKFTVDAGGGMLSAATANTDSQGQARSVLTLGGTVGTNRVTAQLVSNTSLSVQLNETSIAGPAARLLVVSGTGQSGVVGTTLGAPLVVAVQDAHSNPVSGFTVTFRVSSGGGTVTATTGTSGSTGQAATSLILGTTPTTNTVEATAAGLANSPIVFSAGAVHGSPAHLAVVSGNNYVGALIDNVVVSVTDTYGNAVPGSTVTFTNGSPSPDGFAVNMSIIRPTFTAASNAQGQATAPWWISSQSSPHYLYVTVPGATPSPLTFTANP